MPLPDYLRELCVHRHRFTMNREIQQRLLWVKLYETSGDAGFVCRRCGISRPILRKWWRKYLAQGIAGLESHSRRPKSLPSTKTGTCEVAFSESDIKSAVAFFISYFVPLGGEPAFPAREYVAVQG